MKQFFDIVFRHAPRDAIVEFSIGGVLPRHRVFRTVAEVLEDPDMFTGSSQSYFGVGLRTSRELGTKETFAGTSVAWVDYDNLRKPIYILPPTMTVHSGHGYHLYWLLDKLYTRVDQVETTTKALAEALQADAAFDVVRLLRIPDTYNTKRPERSLCEVVETHLDCVYTAKSLYLSTTVNTSLHDLIILGSATNFKSRSERDWYIVKRLVDTGLTDSDIKKIFKYHSCGDKYRDDGDKYFDHTLERAHSTPKVVVSALNTDTGIIESGNSYFKKSGKGSARISTFVLEPKKLLEGKDQDYMMCDLRVESTQHMWRDVVLPKSAFLNVRSLSTALPKISCVWLGTDQDVRTLQSHLMIKLQAIGMPHAFAVTQLGRHEIEDITYYVSENVVLNNKGDVWTDTEDCPLVYVDPRREVPKLVLTTEEPGPEYVQSLVEAIQTVNEPEAIWPLIGWFMATPFKPVIEQYGFRFPILNVSGTRGSGKSTIIQRVFQQLLGYKESRAYSAGTTYFVSLTLLGSSLTVPVAFTEFRAGDTPGFNRFVLLAYDTGRDPRGHADQTTTDYPLTAPFCIDGEDMLDDPAAMERIISVQLSIATIQEGSQAHAAFEDLEAMDLGLLAFPYYKYAISTDVGIFIDRAVDDIAQAFPQMLPSRVRKNLTVCWMGALLFSNFLSKTYGVKFAPERGAEVLSDSLENVYSIKLGRASVAADGFIEAIVNAAARRIASFPWNVEDGNLWFQLSPAFEYWRGLQIRQRQDSLTKQAIRGQLQEMQTEYMLSPETRHLKGRSVIAFGVNLKAAYDSGLDIPESFTSHEFVIELGGSNVD